MGQLRNGPRWLLDPRDGEDTAWLIVHEPGIPWPAWLPAQLRGASLVVVVAHQRGESQEVLRGRVQVRAAETHLSKHRVTGLHMCSSQQDGSERTAVADVIAEQIAYARGGRLVSITPPN